ncbi:MAG: CAP domain-containing protein [Bacteroidales bacterium]
MKALPRKFDSTANVRNQFRRLFLILPLGLLLLPSCMCFLLSIDYSGVSTRKVAERHLSNEEYAARLEADGWPVSELNTAAGHQYMDDEEMNLILAHNLVRHDPAMFARQYVTEYITYFKGTEFHYPGRDLVMLTGEGNKPATELYWELLNTKPAGILFPSQGLHEAAISHADYLVRNETRGHDGQGGLIARIEREGEWEQQIGENINYGSFSPHDALMYMLINDNVADRTHRKNILNPGFRFIGVAMDYHPLFPDGEIYVINYAFYFRETQPDIQKNQQDKKSRPIHLWD